MKNIKYLAIGFFSTLQIAATSLGQVGIQSYDDSLAAARASCATKVVVEPFNNNPPSIIGLNGGITILGGEDGQRRRNNECQTATYFSATSGSYVCVLSDAVGLILGAGSDSLIWSAYSSAVLKCQSKYPASYQHTCAQGPVPCFMR